MNALADWLEDRPAILSSPAVENNGGNQHLHSIDSMPITVSDMFSICFMQPGGSINRLGDFAGELDDPFGAVRRDYTPGSQNEAFVSALFFSCDDLVL